MATISQLMEGKVPGEIKVQGAEYTGCWYFTPYFRANGLWYGTNQNGELDKWRDDNLNWEIYTEPSSASSGRA